MRRLNLLWEFEIQTDHLNSARQLDLLIDNKKKTCRIVDFALLVDHMVKLKESETRDEYLNPTRELKN